jgi:hypothetical protein
MLRVQTRDKLFYSQLLPDFFTAHLFVYPMLTLRRGVWNVVGKIKSPLQ